MAIQIFVGAARQRARLVGELKKLREQQPESIRKLATLEQEVAKLRTIPDRIAELERKIAGYDVVLAEQGVDIDPDDHQPVAPTPRLGYFKHGQCSAACLDALRKAGCPLSTLHVLDYVTKTLGVTFSSHEDRYKTRHVVRHQLAVYARSGLVVRLRRPGEKRVDVAYWSLPQYANAPRRE